MRSRVARFISDEPVMELREVVPTTFKDALVEYIDESNHAGWDNFTFHQVAAVEKFLVDLLKYYNNR